MNRNRAQTVIWLLELVASGDMTAAEALSRWPDIDSEDDPLLRASWHDLSHFAADADIRAGDEEYARQQQELLIKRVKEIKDTFERA